MYSISNSNMVLKLSELQEGDCATIVKINSTGSLNRRIRDLGIMPGEKIYLSKFAPLKDPMILKFKNFDISLRVSEAKNILVEKIIQQL